MDVLLRVIENLNPPYWFWLVALVLISLYLTYPKLRHWFHEQLKRKQAKQDIYHVLKELCKQDRYLRELKQQLQELLRHDFFGDESIRERYHIDISKRYEYFMFQIIHYNDFASRHGLAMLIRSIAVFLSSFSWYAQNWFKKYKDPEFRKQAILLQDFADWDEEQRMEGYKKDIMEHEAYVERSKEFIRQYSNFLMRFQDFLQDAISNNIDCDNIELPKPLE